jgi:hypothetical protein
MLSFNHLLGRPYTSHDPHRKWAHTHYSPQLVERWTYVSSPLLYSHPPGQEQVPQDEEHEGCCDEFMRGLDRRLLVNYGWWIVVFVWCNYLTILYRTPLYIKDVTFVSLPWVIICVRLDPSTHLRRVRVCPLNPGVTTDNGVKVESSCQVTCSHSNEKLHRGKAQSKQSLQRR